MSNNPSDNQSYCYSISELFGQHDKYVIPIYQRNYAWDNTQIAQLVQDIIDHSLTSQNKQSPYHIGTLVVYKRDESVYETIDGQQRLTTLFLLLCCIKNEYEKEYEKKDVSIRDDMIQFDCRQQSTDTLYALCHKKNISDNDRTYNTDILQGYEDVHKALRVICQENTIAIDDFVHTLLDQVKILRVEVPKDTDLNHYFEIMNNRGVQLEKHEILKARCIDRLEQQDGKIFGCIWEACSDMATYVQMGFKKRIRDDIFGADWNTLVDIDTLYQNAELQSKNNTATADNNSISYIINNINNTSQEEDNNNDNTEEKPERFGSIIDFPNFLLHILHIHMGTQSSITLDD